MTKHALISVSDKTGIVPFAKVIEKYGYQIISTGGTAKSLKEAGIKTKDISEITEFPEMMDGRVKTLHPKIHGGLLAVRDNKEHMNIAKKHDISMIDLVVVNLYPFEATIQKKGVSLEEAIENIDIGGPSMLRSAAKNHHSVAVVTDPKDYNHIIEEMEKHDGAITQETKKALAVKVFSMTAHYDSLIYHYLNNQYKPGEVFQNEKITIYNDTTSTSPEATLAAVERFATTSSRLVLIAGGTDRELDFQNWGSRMKNYLNKIDLILLEGSATEKMKVSLRAQGYLEYRSLSECFKMALQKAKETNDKAIILFSPGAKSFEKFKNEFDRGEQFNALVEEYKSNGSL
jgi:hypothetical protein